jgi:WD40 repeat protein
MDEDSRSAGPLPNSAGPLVLPGQRPSRHGQRRYYGTAVEHGTDSEPAVLRGDTGETFALAFSPDGRTLAAGSADGIVKFWSVRTTREVAALKAHESVVSSLAFSPDGRTLASISVDQTMRLWPAPAFAEIDR